MIQGIVGGTGDGKSLLATRYILESLINTDAVVVTNIPLVMGELYQYVSSRLPEGVHFDLDDRVKVLKDEEVMEFYRFRSGGLILPPSPDMDDGDDGTRRLPKTEFMVKMKEAFGLMLSDKSYQRPVHYFIDEAHNYFGSRDWKSNGRALLYYVSQHRHLHDEVYLITQVIDDVEKQFRDRILMTHRSQNQLRMRVGMFKAKGVFRVSVYNRLPGGNKQPMYSVEYDAKHLDGDAVARCYKTVGALGIHSSPESKPNKARFPYWVLWVVGAAGCLGVGLSLFALPYAGGFVAKKVTTGFTESANKALPAISAKADTSTNPRLSSASSSAAKALPSIRNVLKIQRDGVPLLLVTLTDGFQIPPSEVESFNLTAGERWVRWRGQIYR